jgi:glucuronoarabinoxylan endo-1,4-beta-xylanase
MVWRNSIKQAPILQVLKCDGIYSEKRIRSSIDISGELWMKNKWKDKTMRPDKINYVLLTSTIFFVFMVAGCSKDESINGPSDQTSTATIDLNGTQQVIRGFGAANILPWRPDMTTDEVNLAFGTGQGQIGFTLLRLRVPPKDIDTDSFHAQIPTAKLAQSFGAIVFATPWTPPPSMKNSNNTVAGTLYDTSYASYAAYLKSFADYMASNGAPLYAISLQNEPDVSVTYESCYWNAAHFLKFMKNNAAAIGTRIIMPESMNFNHALSDATLNDSAAAANVSIIGGHAYGGGIATYPLAASKGKELWMTEYLDLDTTWSGSRADYSTGVLATGKHINDCMNVGMNAYVWWYIVRYYGPIHENGYVTKRGYVMSQYAKFIRPGYYRVTASASPQTNVDVSAYKNGSKVVIVVLNRNSSSVSQTFSIQNGTVASFIPYVTSSIKNCVQGNDITVSSGGFTTTLDASSITTFISN